MREQPPFPLLPFLTKTEKPRTLQGYLTTSVFWDFLGFLIDGKRRQVKRWGLGENVLNVYDKRLTFLLNVKRTHTYQQEEEQ